MTPTIITRPKRLKIPKAKPEYNEDGEQIYCICRGIDQGSLMIQCDHCKEWFHGTCVGVSSDSAAPDSYSCEKCLELIHDYEQTSPKEESPVEPLKRKATSPASPEAKKPRVTIPSSTDKLRRMASKGFEETFYAIFQEMVAQKDTLGVALRDDIDFEDATFFAEELEEALFQANNNYGIPSDTVFSFNQYKSRFRSLQFNLKDPSNQRLRRRICCVVEDGLDKEKLVSIPPEELGNDAVMEQAEKVARDFVKQAFKPTTVPEVVEEVEVKEEPKPAVAVVEVKVKTPTVTTENQPSLETLLSKLEATPVSTTPVEPVVKEEEVEPDREFIWSGHIKMPQEASFNGSANQVCGPMVPNASWVDIVPTNLVISGRINQMTATKYIYERLEQKSDIVVLEFISDEKSKSGFQKLCKYFSSKQRFGVISIKNHALKDIYLCPVLKQQPILPIITDLNPTFPLNNTSNRDRFFAMIIFSTGYLQKLHHKLSKELKPKKVVAKVEVVAQPVAIVPKEAPPPPRLLEQVGISPDQVGLLIKELISSGILNKA